MAERWGMDVVDVLAERDPFRWAVRIAAHADLVELEKKQQNG